MKPKAAIYHFTNESKQRPKIYRDQLNALEEYAESVGLEVAAIYLDMSIKRSERSEFDRFLDNSGQYEALITKDFYHIAMNTGKCLSIMQQLRDNGLEIYSIENGIFTWEDIPSDKPLQVATYTCHFGTLNEMREIISVRNDILTLFVKKKTVWTIVDRYFDESLHQIDGEQKQLMELIKNRDKYDLLLVHNMNEVHWRTANFCRIREQLQLDIYSLQEGFLAYRRIL